MTREHARAGRGAPLVLLFRRLAVLLVGVPVLAGAALGGGLAMLWLIGRG